MTGLELLTVGRVSVDLYPQQSGVPLSGVSSFAKSIGGSPTNVAVAADRMLERGVSLAVVKMGADGVLVATPEGRSAVPPVPVDVVCGLGAGDAFGGALADGLLAGLDPIEMVTRANAAGAIVAGRLTCSDAMPTAAEIDAVLAGTRPAKGEAA